MENGLLIMHLNWETSLPSKNDSIKISSSSLQAFIMASSRFSSLYTLEIPKLEPVAYPVISYLCKLDSVPNVMDYSKLFEYENNEPIYHLETILK